MDVTVLGIRTDSRDEHPLNRESLIAVIESGRVTETRSVHQ